MANYLKPKAEGRTFARRNMWSHNGERSRPW